MAACSFQFIKAILDPFHGDRLEHIPHAPQCGRAVSWVYFLVRSVCPVASHSVGNLVHAGFELLQLLGLEARAHDAQAVANPGADLTVESPITRRICGRAASPSSASTWSAPGARPRICIALASARRLPGLKR
jgi:hypothetical protein